MSSEQELRAVSEDDAEERAAFLRVVAALRSYEEDALQEVARWEGNYAQLSAAHQALLAQQPAHFADARRCVAANAAFFRALLSTYESPSVPDYLRVPPPPPPGTFVQRTAPGDAEKVRRLWFRGALLTLVVLLTGAVRVAQPEPRLVSGRSR